MSLVTGTVTLSLSEVDSLRDAIKERDIKITELNTELTEVKADKRILKIIKVEIPDIRDIPFSFDHHNYQMFLRNGFHGVDMDTVVRRCLTFHPTMRSGLQERKEFVNFDDVKQDIRNEIENQYNTEINSLKQNVKSSSALLQDLKDKTEAEKKIAVKAHTEEVEKLNKKIKELDDIANNVIKEKAEQSELDALRALCNSLTKQLDQERSKSWYQKLVG